MKETLQGETLQKVYNPKTAFGNVGLIKLIDHETRELARKNCKKCKGNGFLQSRNECPECGGKGVIETECDLCEGVGTTRESCDHGLGGVQ